MVHGPIARRTAAVLAALALSSCGGASQGAPGPRASETGAADRSDEDPGRVAVQALVDGLRAYAPDRAIDPVLVERVAWGPYLTSILALALGGVSPTEREQLVAPWQDELSRAGTEELARAYATAWQEGVAGGACLVAPAAMPGEPLFPRADVVPEPHRARAEAELARTAELEGLYEVRCGDRSFRVAVLRGRPDLVPML